MMSRSGAGSLPSSGGSDPSVSGSGSSSNITSSVGGGGTAAVPAPSAAPAPPASAGRSNNNNNIDRRWELTPYEMERTPQEVMTGTESRMALHPECLRNDFMCPICLKLQCNTVTVMGCLHRFCKDCIIKALSNTNKECPVCRMKLPNKRFLRPDPKFDMLISRIFPLREEEFDEDGDDKSPPRSQRLLRPRAANKGTRMAPDADPELIDDSAEGSNGLVSPMSLAPVEEEIEVIFKPLASGKTRYVKTAPNGTIDHLVKYLTVRFRVDGSSSGNPDESLFTLCVANGPGQFQPVKNHQTLSEIKDQFFSNSDKPIELHYAYNIRSSSEEPSDPQDHMSHPANHHMPPSTSSVHIMHHPVSNGLPLHPQHHHHHQQRETQHHGNALGMGHLPPLPASLTIIPTSSSSSMKSS